MTQVILREDETIESLLRRFKASVQRDGILQEAKRGRYFISNGEKARIKRRQAARRNRRSRNRR